MKSTKIKTVVIEDSGLMRILLADLLRKESNIEVVGTAANGMEGVQKVKELKPDVVITDMIMPEYDGLYVVQKLMEEMPLPVIVLSSLDRTDGKIFDALQAGAFDFLDKPSGENISQGYSPLTNLVNEASYTDYLKLRQRLKRRNTSAHTFDGQLNYDIIAVGASTGGPSAIEMLVNNLPNNLAVPVIIAQHMPERFIQSFSAHLAGTTGLQVSVAKDGEALEQQHIYLAPGTSNIRISRVGSTPRFQFVNNTYKEYNRPSINCLLDSVSETYGNRSIGVILTGMGSDGASGLKKIREAGGLTLSQDEFSSIVYGMPRAAFESGAAARQVSLNEIPNFIISAL